MISAHSSAADHQPWRDVLAIIMLLTTSHGVRCLQSHRHNHHGDHQPWRDVCLLCPPPPHGVMSAATSAFALLCTQYSRGTGILQYSIASGYTWYNGIPPHTHCQKIFVPVIILKNINLRWRWLSFSFFEFLRVPRRKIRLKESNAKCHYLKKFTWKETLRQVFICLRPPSLLDFFGVV